MTEPPAAPALELLAIDTGLVDDVELMAIYSVLKTCEGGRLAAPALPYGHECFKLVLHQVASIYGSFCNSVRMFCGIVFACATIAVPACCRIWAFDRAEVACA